MQPIRGLALTLFFFNILSAWFSPTIAGPGVDLLVIVDQSGSMSQHHNNGRPPNDPGNMRNQIVGMLLNHLYNDQLTSRVVHRMAVLSFGHRTWVNLPFTEVNADSIDTLRTRLNPTSLLRNSNETRVLQAFQEAALQFKRLPKDGARDQRVILITDGRPAFPGYQAQAARYKENMRNVIGQDLANRKLWVFGLNAAAGDYWREYGPFWKNVSHNQAEKLDHANPADIYNRLCEALALCGDPWQPGSRRFVPPYLDAVVFNVFHSGRRDSVSFIPPDSDEPLPQDQMTVLNVGQNLKTIRVTRPKPGPWQIRKNSYQDRVEVRVKQFFVRGTLESPNPSQTLRRTQKTHLQYRVIDTLGHPVVQIPEYPLTLLLDVILPNGERRESLEMIANPKEGPSTYKTKAPFLLEQVGRYQIEMRIFAPDHKGNPIELYKDVYTQLEVEPGNGISAQFSENSPSRYPSWGTWLFTPLQRNVTWRFSDEQGQPIALDRFAHENFLRLALVAENGTEYPIELTKVGEQALGGTLQFPRFPSRTYRWRTTLNQNRVKKPYIVTLKKNPGTVFVRASWWHWLQGLIITALVLSGLGYVARYTYHILCFPLHGHLVFEQKDEYWTHRIPITRRWRRRLTLKSEELPMRMNIHQLDIQSQRGTLSEVLVTAQGPNRHLILAPRLLVDGATVSLSGVPFFVRYESGREK